MTHPIAFQAGTSCEDAMQKYVDLVTEISPSWRCQAILSKERAQKSKQRIFVYVLKFKLDTTFQQAEEMHVLQTDDGAAWFEMEESTRSAEQDGEDEDHCAKARDPWIDDVLAKLGKLDDGDLVANPEVFGDTLEKQSEHHRERLLQMARSEDWDRTINIAQLGETFDIDARTVEWSAVPQYRYSAVVKASVSDVANYAWKHLAETSEKKMKEEANFEAKRKFGSYDTRAVLCSLSHGNTQHDCELVYRVVSLVEAGVNLRE